MMRGGVAARGRRAARRPRRERPLRHAAANVASVVADMAARIDIIVAYLLTLKKNL